MSILGPNEHLNRNPSKRCNSSLGSDDLSLGGGGMPRPLQRACLEQGLRLDLNWLARNGLVQPGKWIAELKIRWKLESTDKEPSIGLLTSNMKGSEGHIRIQIGKIDQIIKLVAHERHFGGQQWYFICPVLQQLCSVVWKSSGASRFASGPAWKRQAAYASQFQTQHDRAISAAMRIRTWLGGPNWATLDGDDPPKPKRMHWRTYRELLERSHRYEEIALGWLADRMNQLNQAKPTDFDSRGG